MKGLKYLASVAVAASLLILTACGEESPQQKADSANSKIERMNTVDSTLGTEGFNLSYDPIIMRLSPPTGMTDSKVQMVRGLLKEYISLGVEVQSLTSSKDVFFTDKAKLDAKLSAARRHLQMLEGYEVREAKVRSEREALAKANSQLDQLNTAVKTLALDTINRHGVSILRLPDDAYSTIYGKTQRQRIGDKNIADLVELQTATEKALSNLEEQIRILLSLEANSEVDQYTRRDRQRETIQLRDNVSANLTVVKSAITWKIGDDGRRLQPAAATSTP